MKLTQKIYCLSILLVTLICIPVHAQIQGPFSSINIGGANMYCTASSGAAVAIYINPAVNRFIGIATNNGYPIIQLGPGFFNSVPGPVGQFWFLHECAHHVVGSNEAMADCFAIKNMRNIGLVTNKFDVDLLLNQISSLPGSYTHLPGPARAQNIYNCLNTP